MTNDKTTKTNETTTNNQETKTMTTHTEAKEAHREAARLWLVVVEREANGKAIKQATKQAEKASAEAGALTEALVDAGWDPEERTDTDAVRSAEEAAEKHQQAAAEHGEEEPKGRGMAATLERYKPGYKPCTAYSGAASQNNGDPIAEALEGKSPEEVMAWAERVLGRAAGSLAERYDGLNPGQKRMNSGNLVRNALKRGDVTAEQILA